MQTPSPPFEPSDGPQPPSHALASSVTLARGLNMLDATSLVVGGVIGSGIFLVPSIVARDVGSPWLSLCVWVVAGGSRNLGRIVFCRARCSVSSHRRQLCVF